MNLKFRAECQDDAIKGINMLITAKELVSQQIYLKKDIPDVTVTIETKTFNRKKIIAVMKCIEDSHVMYQTIQVSSKYTGERDYDV